MRSRELITRITRMFLLECLGVSHPAPDRAPQKALTSTAPPLDPELEVALLIGARSPERAVG